MVVLSSFPPPVDGIKHEQHSTKVLINNQEIGKGTLFIAESRLSWVNSSTGTGFSLEYPHIAIHAVSRDLEAHPEECLYVMVDQQIDRPENTEDDGNSDDDENSDPGMTEMRFVPDDKEVLDAMYQSMSLCQALHPDPADSLSEDDEEIYEDADEDGGYEEEGGGDVIPLNPAVDCYNGENGSNQVGEPMEMDADQFEDADGEEDLH